MKRVRLAVLGTAHVHLADHLDVVAADRHTELAAVHRGSGPWPPRLAGVRPATADEALAGADAALVASTTAEHGPLLRRVAAAGLPVLVEKPLAGSAAQTAELLAVLASGGRPATTAMFLRCAPAFGRLRALLAARAFGELASVEAGFSHPGLPDGLFDGPAGWMLDAAHGPAGAFADLAVHLVDLLGWLAPGAGLRVLGAVLRHRPGLAADVGGAALLSWGGVPVSVRAGWASRPGGVSVRVEGERGTARVDGGRLTLTGAGERVEEYPPPRAGAALEGFLAGLRGERRWAAPTCAEILRGARVMDAIGRRTSQSLIDPAPSTPQPACHPK
ncbi:Gfo/Idh/MocA family oxidoreductase [Kitasatospora sp. NPDC088351]|uniref:Gfo/Idh/MocA family protein n=1 Tax=unclassified Kitasatospora TaxID=2633591 RepID=UPI003444B7F5